MSTLIATNIIDSLSVMMLISSFFVVANRRLSHIVPIISFQALLLSLISATVAYATRIEHIYVVALLTFLVKSLLVPVVLLYVLKKIVVLDKVEAICTAKVTILSCLLLVIVAFYVTEPIIKTAKVLTQNSLPVSISLILIGLFIMITRKKALMQVIGLITMENGLYLTAISTTYGMPLIVELGIFFDLLVGVIIMGILSYRINQAFDSINTDKLQKLKG